MPGSAAKVVITERQRDVLQAMVGSRSCPQGLAHRAEIVLLAFGGDTNEGIAERLHCERHGVGDWRRRWQTAFARLVVIECVEPPAALRAAIAEVLGDLPRAGCGGTFTAEQIAQILAVACEPPEDSGRPVTHWTPRELTDEVIRRGIVASISVRHVGRFLKDGRTSAAPPPLLAQPQAGRPGGLPPASRDRLRVLSGRPAATGRRRDSHRLRGREDRDSGVGAPGPDQADAAGPNRARGGGLHPSRDARSDRELRGGDGAGARAHGAGNAR